MGFWTFILIVIAVALGVNRGLKIHENPESIDNLLELIWVIVKFLVKVGLLLLIIGGIGYGIYLGIDWIGNINWKINIPDRVVGTISLIIFGGLLAFSFWINVKEKGGFKIRFKEKKDARKKRKQAKKDRMAKMTKEEIKEYKKHKRKDKLLFGCLIFLAIITLLLLGAGFIYDKYK